MDIVVNYSLFGAVREGSLERTRELINSYGLSYSKAWSEGYVLLRDALENGHVAVAKLLLTSGSKVNSKVQNPCKTALHYAVIKGDIEIVEMLIGRGANIHAKDQYGRAPLFDAIKREKMKVIELLLQHGADANARDNNGTSLLHIAAEAGCLQIAEYLLNYGAYINCQCSQPLKIGYAPLHFAVEKGNKEVTTLLLRRGANVDVKAEDSITPLHIAAKNEFIDIAQDLLNHGACIHSFTTENGYTPLHFASEQGSEKSVKLFLNKGTDINASTDGNLTPLYIAIKAGKTSIVKLLLQHGAKVDNQDIKDGKTALHLAIDKGNLTIVEDILKYDPDINDKRNRNSLKVAVCGYGNEYIKIVEALLEYGFMVTPEDASDPKLLHDAVEKGCLKIIEDLLKYGADVNMLDNSNKGFTPLHSAAKHKQEEVAKLLISYEADINAKDNTGKTPIFYAIQDVNSEITKLLLTNGAEIKDSPDLLTIAVKKECIEIVKVLLQHDADINASDKYGTTALHFTALGERVYSYICNPHLDFSALSGISYAFKDSIKGEIAELLLNKGANVDAQNEDGATALHIATHMGYREVVKVLLKCGANIDSRDACGRTALHIASLKGHGGVVDLLLGYGSNINIKSRDNHTPLDYAMTGIRSFYNSDFNNYRNYDSYDYYYDDDDYYVHFINPCEAIAKTLKYHILKLKSANLYVTKNNLESIKDIQFSPEGRDYQDKCEKELEIMKSEKIYNFNISFYDILTKGTSSLAIYMRNENIVQALKYENYKTRFPMYASMIQCNFRKGMERNELLKQCNKCFHFLLNNVAELPYDCTEKIFSYLSNNDLRVLIDACKPIH